MPIFSPIAKLNKSSNLNEPVIKPFKMGTPKLKIRVLTINPLNEKFSLEKSFLIISLLSQSNLD